VAPSLLLLKAKFQVFWGEKNMRGTMKTCHGLRPGLIGASLLSFTILLTGATGRLLASDGSGFATAVPNSVQSGSTGNNFALQYTATEAMGDGSVQMTVPNGFPNPTANNTTVTVVNGIGGDVLDDLEAVPLPLGNPGWNADDGLPILNLVSVASDSGEHYEGARSLEVNFLANLGLFTPSVWYNFDVARNWSGYTRLSFRVKLSTLLTAALDLGDAEVRISESSDLSNPTVYNLKNALIEVDLLDSGQWAQVIVDLTSAPATTRDAVMSYGLKFPALTAGAATSLNLDYILLGPGSPVFDGATATENLISLDDGGTVTFNYHDITAPTQTGTYTVGFSNRDTAAGHLTTISDPPVIQVIDVNTQDCRQADADSDGAQEQACDTNGDGCFGDAYFDPDGSSVACLTIDGNNDGCSDFFIDVNGSGCAKECPEVFWDPTRGILTPITVTSLDVNGDGVPEEVCAFDSDGDGGNDSFVQPNPKNPTDSGIGGQGVGQINPFVEGAGCSLQGADSNAAAWPWAILLLNLCLVWRGMRTRKIFGGLK